MYSVCDFTINVERAVSLWDGIVSAVQTNPIVRFFWGWLVGLVDAVLA